MNQRSGKRRAASIALCLIILLAGGCTNLPENPSDSPSLEPSPPPLQEPSPSPSELPAPVAEVTVKSAPQWNDFARSFNEDAEKYADPLTVLIGGRLDFARHDFIPLRRPFNGTVRGTAEVEGYTGEAVRQESLWPGGHGTGFGFFNITSIENITGDPVKVYSAEAGFPLTRTGQPNLDDYVHGRPVEVDGETVQLEVETSESLFGLFGLRCGDLILENLVFSNIRAKDLRHIIAKSVDSLTMRNVEIINCSFQQTTALLACNAGRVDIDNLFVSRCDVNIITCGGGLFTWVFENAAFSRTAVILSNVLLLPDGGGSGYTAAAAALLVTRIGGGASFSQIEVYGSSVYSLQSVVLCHDYGSLAELSDITVRSSSFLGFPHHTMMGPPDNSILVGGWEPRAGDRILLRDSMFNVYGSFDDYIALGYAIENCIDVLTG